MNLEASNTKQAVIAELVQQNIATLSRLSDVGALCCLTLCCAGC